MYERGKNVRSRIKNTITRRSYLLKKYALKKNNLY